MTKLTQPTQIEQIQAACDALAAKMGSKAEVRVTISGNVSPFVFCYPRGSADKWYIIEHGEPLEALAKVEAIWAERAKEMAEKTIQAIALAIIRLTHEFGECSDAALRAEFDARDIERLGADAVEQANVMADKGPFSITVQAGANDREVA